MDLELLHTWAGRALGTMPSDREDGRQLGVAEELQVRFRSDVSALWMELRAPSSTAERWFLYEIQLANLH